MPAEPNPDLALRLAKALVDLYATAGLRLLELVARRLARGINSPGWAETKLLEIVRLRDDAVAVLDKLTEAGPERVQEAIERAFDAGLADAAEDIDDVELVAGPSLAPVDRLVTEQVAGLRALRPGILRQVEDAYRTVIAETAGPVTAGTMTRRQAAGHALDRFAQRGITGFVDRGGRRWELETYVETGLRTAVGRAQVAGTLDRLQAAGRDLVIVSDHVQECSLCLVPGTVVEGPVPEWRCRTEYAGDVISVSTAAGKHLTGTPEHPVLTPLGWRRLKDLHPGDEVIGDLGEHGVARVVPHDVQMPALIEEAGEAFAPLLLASPPRRHLDSYGSYREIRAVWPDRDLLTERHAALVEPVGDLLFVGGLGPLLGGDDLPDLLGGLGSSSGCLMCRIEHGGAFLGGGVSPPLAHPLARHGGSLLVREPGHVLDDRVMPRPGFDAGPTQVVAHHPAADAEGGAELLRALAGHVAADEIVGLGRRQFRGHVWDLQTGPAWFLANGIVTHNCRPWEGKVLSITGATPGHVTVAAAQAAGLHHPNCRHGLTAYIPGLTTIPTGTDDPDGDRARQELRRLERGIRAWKRRAVVALDPDARRRAEAHARQWQGRLRAHVAAHDLTRKRERERLGAR